MAAGGDGGRRKEGRKEDQIQRKSAAADRGSAEVSRLRGTSRHGQGLITIIFVLDLDPLSVLNHRIDCSDTGNEGLAKKKQKNKKKNRGLQVELVNS